MLSNHKSFILTTKSDQSLGFFMSKNVQVAYFEDTDDELKNLLDSNTFDVVYIRDPFNTSDYTLENITTKLNLVFTTQPNARYVDHVRTTHDVLIEDKWQQYELFREYMPATSLGSGADFIEGKNIAKKRISSRSKDILFSLKSPLNDEWIVQDMLDIREELRIYVVRGKVLPQAALRSSKKSDTKVKVMGTKILTKNELDFAQTIAHMVPQLDFIGLDIAITPSGLKLIELNRSPQFKRYNELSGTNIVEGFLDTMHDSDTTLGIFENVSFPELGVKNALAKVDTGAYSGALHCTDIKVFRRGKDKKRILKFVPLGDKKYSTETDQFEETYVRSSTGHRIKRFVITTTITVAGVTYQTKIGLSNRSDMKREVLLGRRFLRENNLLVDVRKNSEFDDEGENTR